MVQIDSVVWTLDLTSLQNQVCFYKYKFLTGTFVGTWALYQLLVGIYAYFYPDLITIVEAVA